MLNNEIKKKIKKNLESTTKTHDPSDKTRITL
jgi:hypothetical protein